MAYNYFWKINGINYSVYVFIFKEFKRLEYGYLNIFSSQIIIVYNNTIKAVVQHEI